MRFRILAAVSAAILMLAPGCGGESGDSSASAAREAPAPSVDPSDPIQVAEEFYDSVDRGDLEAAVQWVLPEQQEDFRAAMQAGMPPLPDGYQVVVLAQGDHAEASITGAQIEVDLQLREGRWWVAN